MLVLRSEKGMRMLRRLKIENFKCWQNTGDISLAPLTLLFGTNSSGKSSIGQFLMMLKQTAEKGDRKAAFYLGFNGKDSYVQLGSYRDIAYHHDLSNHVKFSYDWDAEEMLSTFDSHSGREYKWNFMSFNADVAFRDNGFVPYVHEFEYKLDGGGTPFAVRLVRQAKGDYKLEAEGYQFIRNTGRVWNSSSTVGFYGFPDELNTYYQNSQFVQTLNFQQERFFRKVFYLGPMRTRPERVYSWSGNEPDGVGDSGEQTIPAILAAKDRLINLKKKQRTRKFGEVIANSLKKLGLIDSFVVEPLSHNNNREYEVKVKTKNSPDLVNLPDVGFGISQVLPVLVACFYVPPGSILLIDEPEIHLHPSAQSQLADVFIDVLNARENGDPRNVQLIVETHSEHLLRRLQRRMAEEWITNEQAVAYFVDMDSAPSKLKKLDVDGLGNIRNWPKDFFGNEMKDVIEQTRIAIKRSNENCSASC